MFELAIVMTLAGLALGALLLVAVIGFALKLTFGLLEWILVPVFLVVGFVLLVTVGPVLLALAAVFFAVLLPVLLLLMPVLLLGGLVWGVACVV